MNNSRLKYFFLLDFSLSTLSFFCVLDVKWRDMAHGASSLVSFVSRNAVGDICGCIGSFEPRETKCYAERHNLCCMTLRSSVGTFVENFKVEMLVKQRRLQSLICKKF